MKRKNEIELTFEEIAHSESEEISGGFLLLTALSLVGGIAAVCAIAYYTGYGVGYLTNCGE